MGPSRRRSGALLLACLVLATFVGARSPAVAAVGADPGLSQQWALRQIGAPAAWATSVGSGVPIAVIDTGIEKAHEDLRDQLAAAVTCVGTGGDPGKCKVDGADIQGHGSHVAGIAAAASNSAGIAGVAPGARIVAVRVFTESRDLSGEPVYGANTDDINAGIRWAVRNVAAKGAINLSLGDDFPIALGSAGFEDGIEEAWAAGWVPVLAAGNEGNLLGLNGEEYGAMNALVVGATGPDGELADYSSPLGSAKWGLVAPGGNARAAGSKGACQSEPAKCVLSTYKGGEYGLLQGTSMATPHVAGAVALVMSAGLSNAAAVERLLATTDKSRDCGGGCKGRLDVAKAVAGLAPAGGGGSGGGGGAPASTDPPPTAATTPAPTTTARAASPRRGAPPATTAPAATTPAPSEPVPAVTEEAAPMPVETTPPLDEEDDAVVGLSVEEAADATDDAGANDSTKTPPALLVAAVLAMGGVAGTTLFAWRRRWDAAG